MTHSPFMTFPIRRSHHDDPPHRLSSFYGQSLYNLNSMNYLTYTIYPLSYVYRSQVHFLVSSFTIQILSNYIPINVLQYSIYRLSLSLPRILDKTRPGCKFLICLLLLGHIPYSPSPSFPSVLSHPRVFGSFVVLSSSSLINWLSKYWLLYLF